jgi:hypothetical protein
VNRSAALRAIAIGLVAWGVWQALHVPGLLVGTPAPLLLLGFALQAILGIVAGVAVWRGASWAPLGVVLLGASIAATAGIEGFVLGIRAYLPALFEAVAAVVVGLAVAAYVGRAAGSRRG